jgi:hypothetical protein
LEKDETMKTINGYRQPQYYGASDASLDDALREAGKKGVEQASGGIVLLMGGLLLLWALSKKR